MNRWAALVKIVESFNRGGKPWHAFGVVALFFCVPLVCVLLSYRGFGYLLLPQ